MPSNTLVDGDPISVLQLIDHVEEALVPEGWEQRGPALALGTFGATFTRDPRLTLSVVERLDGSVRADLASETYEAMWSVIMIRPTLDQVLGSARSATTKLPNTEADLVVALRLAGWGINLHAGRPDSGAWGFRPDRRRCVFRSGAASGYHTVEWRIDGDGVDAIASGDTPSAVVAALALTD